MEQKEITGDCANFKTKYDDMTIFVKNIVSAKAY